MKPDEALKQLVMLNAKRDNLGKEMMELQNSLEEKAKEASELDKQIHSILRKEAKSEVKMADFAMLDGKSLIDKIIDETRTKP